MTREKRLADSDWWSSSTAAHLVPQEALYRLMIWLSPAYPVGAFSYSSGIEWAVESGDITDAETLCNWIEATLTAGAGINDGIFFSQTHRAVTGDDDVAIVKTAELAAAFAPTREPYYETTTLGRALCSRSRSMLRYALLFQRASSPSRTQ